MDQTPAYPSFKVSRTLFQFISSICLLKFWKSGAKSPFRRLLYLKLISYISIGAKMKGQVPWNLLGNGRGRRSVFLFLGSNYQSRCDGDYSGCIRSIRQPCYYILLQAKESSKRGLSVDLDPFVECNRKRTFVKRHSRSRKLGFSPPNKQASRGGCEDSGRNAEIV